MLYRCPQCNKVFTYSQYQDEYTLYKFYKNDPEQLNKMNFRILYDFCDVCSDKVRKKLKWTKWEQVKLSKLAPYAPGIRKSLFSFKSTDKRYSLQMQNLIFDLFGKMHKNEVILSYPLFLFVGAAYNKITQDLRISFNNREILYDFFGGNYD